MPASPTRRSRRRVPPLVLIIVTGIVAVAWWVTRSPVFSLRTLRVTGLHHLSTADVRRLADLGPDTDVFWLSTAAMERRLERNPWVLRAEVSRSLPSTVSVSVRERMAVAVLAGRGVLVASDGVVLGPAGSARLPLIDGTPRPLSGGSEIPASTPGLVVAAGLPPAIRPLVGRVATDRRGGIVVVLRDGTSVLYGDATSAPAKGRALQAVLAWIGPRAVRARYIDVEAPFAPALLPAAGSPASPVPVPSPEG